MKEHPEEKLIKEILIKGTEMKAPKDLSSRILNRWELEEDTIPSFVPIFPGFTWWIIAFFFAGMLIWAFSKMSFSSTNSDMTIMMDQVLENLKYAMVGFEDILFPSLIVLVIMVLLNVILLKYRNMQSRVLG